MTIQVLKLQDEFQTEIRFVNYMGCIIRIEKWKNLGYRLERKACQIHWEDGKITPIPSRRHDNSFKTYLSNASLIRDSKAEIRKTLELRKAQRPELTGQHGQRREQ